MTRGAELISERPGQYLEPAIPQLLKKRGPFECDEDLLLAAFYDDAMTNTLKETGPINTDYPIMSTPLKTLVKEVASRSSVRSFKIRTGPE